MGRQRFIMEHGQYFAQFGHIVGKARAIAIDARPVVVVLKQQKAREFLGGQFRQMVCGENQRHNVR